MGTTLFKEPRGFCCSTVDFYRCMPLLPDASMDPSREEWRRMLARSMDLGDECVTPEIDRSAAAETGARIYVRQQETWHGVPSAC
jgi:hypothetical protein